MDYVTILCGVSLLILNNFLILDVKNENFRDFYQVVSCFFFSLLGYQVKLELSHNTIENIVFFRSFLGAIILYLYVALKEKPLSKIARLVIILFIYFVSFGVLAMYFGYNALNYITLAQASTLSFTKVFFQLSSFILSLRKINIRKDYSSFSWFWCLFISEPGTFDNSKGFYMAIFSALCVSGGVISIAYLSKRENKYHSLVSF